MGRPGKKRDRLRRPVLEAAAPSPTLGDQSDSAEARYAAQVSLAHRRRWAQFFTPPAIADLMADWLARGEPRDVLDPAVGAGVLVRKILARRPSVAVTAIDKDGVVLQAFQGQQLGRNVESLHADFLKWKSPARFDAIIANPPYLRHHDFDYAGDIFAEIGSRCEIEFSRLTNLYGLFLIEICRRLRPGGRAAVITPGEWLNANFGQPLKRWLLERGLISWLVYFSHAELIFGDALTTASVLLLEKPPRAQQPTEKRPAILYAGKGAAIQAIADCVRENRTTDSRLTVHRLAPEELLRHKWNGLLESATAAPSTFVRLGELATTRRGIATGANRFFHVSQSEMERYGLAAGRAEPCIGRAATAPGLVYRADDHQNLVDRDKPAYLLRFDGRLSRQDREYLQIGEEQGLADRFLLSQRKPWYSQETCDPAPIWAAVFGRSRLRFIWNAAGIRHLTTFHGVYPHDVSPLAARALAACLNSRVVQQQALRHVRVYAGGLKKFEPRDLLDLEVPDLRTADDDQRAQLAAYLDNLDQRRRLAEDDSRLLADLDRLVMQIAANE